MLVEKAFTVTPAATREIAAVASENGVFAMEAMWTRFQPAIVRMRELIADGAVGEVRTLQADLGRPQPARPGRPVRSPRSSAAARCSTWPSTRSRSRRWCWATRPRHRVGTLAATGIDVEETVLLGFDGGRTADPDTLAPPRCPGQARVFGTDGWIDVLPRFHHPDTIVLHRHGARPEKITLPATGGGYSHELIEVTECVRDGRPESATMPLADTIAVQDVMGEVARQLGMAPLEGPADL